MSLLKKIVALDIETYDPNLHTFGDGSCRTSGSSDDDNGCILCVSTYDGMRAKAYYPFTADWHELEEILADENTDIICHNGDRKSVV